MHDMSVVDENNRAYVGVEKDGDKQTPPPSAIDVRGEKVSRVVHHMISIMCPAVRTVYSAAFFRHTVWDASYSATAPFRDEANPFPVPLSLPLPLPARSRSRSSGASSLSLPRQPHPTAN